MTRQWRKEKQSDFAKPGFSLDQCTLLNPDFSYTLQRRSAPVWGSHVFFNLKPQITRGHIYIRQYTINGRTVSSVNLKQPGAGPHFRVRDCGMTLENQKT